MLLLKYFIEFVVDDEPDWVTATRRRREYRCAQELEERASQIWHAVREDGISAHDEYKNRLQMTPHIEWHVDPC